MLQARRTDRLNALVAEFGAGRVLPVAGDVREPESATALVEAAEREFGRLDSMVVNAGVGMYGGILDRSDEDLQTMMRTNVEGTVWAVRAAVRSFRSSGGGDVVIVASVAGLRGGADEAVYAATKFAQVGLAGALDREVRTDGIRVTAICPAGVETEFAIGAGRTEGDPSLADYLRPEDVAFAVTTCSANLAGSGPPSGSCGAWARAADPAERQGISASPLAGASQSSRSRIAATSTAGKPTSHAARPATS